MNYWLTLLTILALFILALVATGYTIFIIVVALIDEIKWFMNRSAITEEDEE